MPSGQDAKVLSSTEHSSLIAKESKTGKKKRPRIRDRPRNKRNRSKSANTIDNEAGIKQDTEANKTQSVVPPNNSFQQQQNQQPTSLSSFANTDKTMQPTTESITASGKTREQILAEREAKKLAKQTKKNKSSTEASMPQMNGPNTVQQGTPVITKSISSPQVNVTIPQVNNDSPAVAEKTREQIKADREAKKQAKQSTKASKSADGKMDKPLVEKIENLSVKEISEKALVEQMEGKILEDKKKPVLTKAERRAIQEVQRAAKAQIQAQKTGKSALKPPATRTAPTKPSTETLVSVEVPTSSPTKTVTFAKGHDCKIKLFNHLESVRKDVSLFINNTKLHPSMARLGEQYAKRTIVGSNARCIAFLNALKMVIQDFETPPKKEFARSLEATIKSSVEHLHNCRPLAVSVSNAFKHIGHVLTQLPTDQPESELKENLCHFIDTYIENQIGKAAQAISSSMQEKITNGDVILTFGCSSLISYICEEAYRRHVDFRVIVVDSRPFCEGQELLRRLTAKEIPCTYVLINAIGFVMPEATKVLLGAHALLSNGYVMARTGTAQVALVARSFNVPVLVCCETHKFSERFQTDAIVYNELGNPDDLVINDKCCLTNWQAKGRMSPLNLIYDITPPELVTAVVTEVSILPCTSVPVILRIKPTEIGYYS